MSKPLILVTNDDGIKAPGMRVLAEEAAKIGDVVVISPHTPKSGMSHAITIDAPLRVREVQYGGEFRAYECSGTPVDCVKLALGNLLPKAPDLVLSGINHGGNYSVNTLYSGTMGAALEGYLMAVSSIGFSYRDHSLAADFSEARQYVVPIIEMMLAQPQQPLLFNVNVPKIGERPIQGVKICRQAKAYWKEAFDERTDPSGGQYFWMKGEYTLLDPGEDTDYYALKNHYISVVPQQADMTDFGTMQQLQQQINAGS